MTLTIDPTHEKHFVIQIAIPSMQWQALTEEEFMRCVDRKLSEARISAFDAWQGYRETIRVAAPA